MIAGRRHISDLLCQQRNIKYTREVNNKCVVIVGAGDRHNIEIIVVSANIFHQHLSKPLKTVFLGYGDI